MLEPGHWEQTPRRGGAQPEIVAAVIRAITPGEDLRTSGNDP